MTWMMGQHCVERGRWGITLRGKLEGGSDDRETRQAFYILFFICFEYVHSSIDTGQPLGLSWFIIHHPFPSGVRFRVSWPIIMIPQPFVHDMAS